MSSSGRRSVLCIEGKQLHAQSVALVLEHHGYPTFVASGSGAAIEILKAQHIDIVLIDYLVCISEQVCFRDVLLKIEPKLKFILFSSHPERPSICRNQSMDVLIKPLHPTVLMAEIERVCSVAA